MHAPRLSGRVCTARRTLIPFPDFKNKLDRPFFSSLQGGLFDFLISSAPMVDTHVPLPCHARNAETLLLLFGLALVFRDDLIDGVQSRGVWNVIMRFCFKSSSSS